MYEEIVKMFSCVVCERASMHARTQTRSQVVWSTIKAVGVGTIIKLTCVIMKINNV